MTQLRASGPASPPIYLRDDLIQLRYNALCRTNDGRDVTLRTFVIR